MEVESFLSVINVDSSRIVNIGNYSFKSAFLCISCCASQNMFIHNCSISCTTNALVVNELFAQTIIFLSRSRSSWLMKKLVGNVYSDFLKIPVVLGRSGLQHRLCIASLLEIPTTLSSMRYIYNFV